LPLGRAFPTTERDRLIREVVLLLKTGHLDVGYFRDKYGVDIRKEFQNAFAKLADDGWLTMAGDNIDCTSDGLMQIDRHLPAFFDPQYVSSRYT
jgi:oxygen-independent coproporphyrinogen-3 oxidase